MISSGCSVYFGRLRGFGKFCVIVLVDAIIVNK